MFDLYNINKRKTRFGGNEKVVEKSEKNNNKNNILLPGGFRVHNTIIFKKQNAYSLFSGKLLTYIK